MADSIDFEIYEILHLADWKEDTIIKIRVFGFIDSKQIDFDNDIIAPSSLNTYDEINDFLLNLLMKYFDNVIDTPIEDLIKSRWLMNVDGVN